MAKYLITADCDWIQGHLRFGHYEGTISEEQYQEYLKLKDIDDEERDFVCDLTHLIVDDYRIDDYARPTNIQIKKIEE